MNGEGDYMKAFVTGVNGQLGFDVMNELARLGHEGIGSDLNPTFSGIRNGTPVMNMPYVSLDITDGEEVKEVITRLRPDVVIHCAAWTAVDKAEENESTAFAVNESGTRNIAVACRDIGAKIIYISTDYVFPGTGDQFYKPEDEKGPLNVYGRSKLAGEAAVQELLERYFIVRISWVFGLNGSNFIRTMLRLSETRSEIGVVADQVGSPTYTSDLAPLLCNMAGTEQYGIYHATNEGVCSWAELAKEVFKVAGKNVMVRSLATADYPSKAARPLNSRMDKSSLDLAGFSRLPEWQDAVGRYITELRKLD